MLKRFIKTPMMTRRLVAGSVRPMCKHVVKAPIIMPELSDSSIMTKTFPSFLMEKFDSFGDDVAIVDGSTNKGLTYGELTVDTKNVAAALQKHGVKHHDAVALMSPNHLNFFSIFMGISLSGAYSTCLNPMYEKNEIQHQLLNTGAKMIFVHPLCLEKVIMATEDVKDSIDVVVIDDGADIKSYPNRKLMKLSDMLKDQGDAVNEDNFLGGKNAPHFDPNQILSLPFSSGTTGLAKGVMLTHRNLVANLLQFIPYESGHVARSEANPKGGTLLVPLPFFHIYGLVGGLFNPLYLGGKTVFMPAFDPQRFLELIPEHKVTRAYIVPPIALFLAKHPIVDKFDLSSVKCLLSGAAPLGSDVQKMAAGRLGCVVKQAWGMTELSPAGTITPDEVLMTPEGMEKLKGTSGLLVPGTEAKIVDTETQETVDPLTEGELLLKGPQVMKGYWKNEQATHDTITDDGWLRTGDIAHFDKDGYLYLTDRLKELIKYKGFQVPPAELEATILTMDQVADVIVIPVLDDEAGEIPRAYVVKQASCPKDFKEQDVIDFVAERVAPHKKLRGGVIFTESVPKSPSGKLLRRIQIAQDRAASK